MPIIVLETMRLWACALHRGPTKAKSTVRTMSRLRLWDQEAGRCRQLKREVCLLLPHGVQSGGTLFAAGFPDFFHWFVSEDKQPTPEENGLCMHVGKHIHTGQPTWHSLTFKVEPTFPEWASYKDRSPWQSTASQVGCCLRPWLARAAGFEGMRRSFNPLVISHGEKERREEGMTSARNRTSDHHVETIVEEHSPHTGARAADSWSQ